MTGGVIMADAMKPWFVYLIRTAGDEIYTGISPDVERRLAAHANGLGAKFLRGRGPLTLLYHCRIGERGLAQRVEIRMKRLARPDKERIASARPTRARLLRELGIEVPARKAAADRRSVRRQLNDAAI